MKKKDESINLLDLIPVKNVPWEMNNDNLIVLLKPKFTNRWMVKHFVPLMRRPSYRIYLDKFGTSVWNYCDGKSTVTEIGAALRKQFGEEIEPVYERLGQFIRTLKNSNFIHYLNY